MIPAYYIRIDKVPLKANGKMDRKALPKPDASDFKTDYVAPENETQEKLCKAMATVLGLEQVGINDDFYELGGDSLGSIKVITESDLPDLTQARSSAAEHLRKSPRCMRKTTKTMTERILQSKTRVL